MVFESSVYIIFIPYDKNWTRIIKVMMEDDLSRYWMGYLTIRVFIQPDNRYFFFHQNTYITLLLFFVYITLKKNFYKKLHKGGIVGSSPHVRRYRVKNNISRFGCFQIGFFFSRLPDPPSPYSHKNIIIYSYL